MDKWAYIVVDFKVDTSRGDWIGMWTDGKENKSHRGMFGDILNALGEDGWELVSYGTPWHESAVTFKRRKP